MQSSFGIVIKTPVRHARYNPGSCDESSQIKMRDQKLLAPRPTGLSLSQNKMGDQKLLGAECMIDAVMAIVGLRPSRCT